MSTPWYAPSDPETETVTPMSVPCIVDVVGETGGKWLLTGDLQFAWCPASEGIARNLRGLPHETWTQERFDEFTDDTKRVFFSIVRGKP